MTTREDIESQYAYDQLTEDQRVLMGIVRKKFKDLALEVHAETPSNRAQSLALTHLQIAKFFAVQSVVDGATAPLPEVDSKK